LLGELGLYAYPEYEVITVYDLKHKGAAYARNRGLEIAKGELVHFIDDDAFPLKDNLLLLVRAYNHFRAIDSKVGGVQGALLPKAPWGSSKVVTKISLTNKGVKTDAFDGPGLTDHVNTCNALFLKSVLEEVRGFDEKITYVYDDVDLSFKIRAMGYHLYAVPDAVVFHKSEEVWKQPVKAKIYSKNYYATRNKIILHRKWCSRKSAYRLSLKILGGSFFRLLLLIPKSIGNGDIKRNAALNVLGTFLAALSGLLELRR
jgi:GT2 family glycosyltransferase